MLHLSRKYEAARVEKACARALRLRAFSYKTVAAILQHHLDRSRLRSSRRRALPLHENVRGPDYYH